MRSLKILVGYLIDGRHSGIDKYLLNLLEVAYANGVCLDFLTNEIDPELKQHLDKFGSELIQIPTLKSPFSQYKVIRQILAEGSYDRAYFNISEPFNMIGALAAKRSRVPVYVHSHSCAIAATSTSGKVVRSIASAVCRPVMNMCAARRFACSDKAAEWLFGSKADSAEIIYNAIDASRFEFNAQVRDEVRKELGIEGKTVVGHIGNIQYPKNQIFLVETFAEFAKLEEDSVLLIIGTGPDEDAVRQRVDELSITDNVRFLGIRSDVERLVQAMDIFVFPSLYEGLGIVLIEAQFSGLPCVASDSISRMAVIAQNTQMLDLSLGAKEWARVALAAAKQERRAAEISDENVKKFDLSAQREQLIDEILR